MATRFQQQLRLLNSSILVLEDIGRELAKTDPSFLNEAGGMNRRGKVNISKVIRYQLAKSDPRFKPEVDFDGRL